MSLRRLGASLVLGSMLPCIAVAEAPEVDSKAVKITFTGRVQALWSHTTIDRGDPSNEFLMRRVRGTMKVKINDWVSGIVEPDFGEGKAELRDAYVKLEPNDYFSATIGQAKRRFDLFELTSSTQILVIERDGRIGRKKYPSLSYFTEDLGFADRDIGVFVSLHDEDERFNVDAAITNGAGANKKAEIGEKAFQGRVSVVPVADFDLQVSAGVSVKPFEKGAGAAADSLDVRYASAFEGSIEYGSFKSGPHVQAGVVLGSNSKKYDAAKNESPTFTALQAIATYKRALVGNRWLEAVEPLVRVSYADPNTDTDKDGGIVVTPGFNAFLAHRNRLSVNADIWLPQADDDAATAFEEDKVQVGLKIASWLFF